MGKNNRRPAQPHHAGTGRFVTAGYARKHPGTTMWIRPKK